MGDWVFVQADLPCAVCLPINRHPGNIANFRKAAFSHRERRARKHDRLIRIELFLVVRKVRKAHLPSVQVFKQAFAVREIQL